MLRGGRLNSAMRNQFQLVRSSGRPLIQENPQLGEQSANLVLMGRHPPVHPRMTAMRSFRTVVLGIALAGALLANPATASDDVHAAGYNMDVPAVVMDFGLSRDTLVLDVITLPASDGVLHPDALPRAASVAPTVLVTGYATPRLDRRLSIATMTARTWSRAGDEALPATPDLAEPPEPKRRA